MNSYIYVPRDDFEKACPSNYIARYLDEMDAQGWELVCYSPETECEARGFIFKQRVNKLEILEKLVQLHERVRIVYVVDGYMAVYSDLDGDRDMCSAEGATILDALFNLQRRLGD
jgi:hypothetical protein